MPSINFSSDIPIDWLVTLSLKPKCERLRKLSFDRSCLKSTKYIPTDTNLPISKFQPNSCNFPSHTTRCTKYPPLREYMSLPQNRPWSIFPHIRPRSFTTVVLILSDVSLAQLSIRGCTSRCSVLTKEVLKYIGTVHFVSANHINQRHLTWPTFSLWMSSLKLRKPTSYLALGTLPTCDHSHPRSWRECQRPTCTLYTDFETRTRRCVFRPAGRTYVPHLLSCSRFTIWRSRIKKHVQTLSFSQHRKLWAWEYNMAMYTWWCLKSTVMEVWGLHDTLTMVNWM